jgi:hypothetical protein
MTYEQFENLINTYEKIYNDFSELYSIGFNLLEGKYAIEEPVGKLVDIALESNFSEEGVSWVEWYMLENEFGKKDWSKLKSLNNEPSPSDKYGARDQDGNPICYDIKSLWEEIQQYKLK